ncbi:MULTISPECIES: hypothetical protein [Novosphingobium]|uniref:Uncharacterized protein n=1 Tax=Novosphingobium sediminicola TaxID=563162 RepID=A0A7W6G5Q3_9SPHN|nr:MULTISPECIES: hypothetical protein [Novosphingobium]MBB3954340.1 hypothetical protein [Novosphingobium sediminicola]NOW47800.1 hypothetical protein [Novosphingobium sp. SG751A]
MQEAGDPTAWSALILGLAALAAGAGALRQPGVWQTMIGEVEGSPALQFLCGMLELLVGSVVYLANPWIPHDLLTCIIKALGGLMMAESLAILFACDLYTQMWLKTLGNFHKGWAGITTLIGLALTVIGMARFG